MKKYGTGAPALKVHLLFLLSEYRRFFKHAVSLHIRGWRRTRQQREDESVWKMAIWLSVDLTVETFGPNLSFREQQSVTWCMMHDA